MTRIAELITLLDSEDEPLPKRLKTANCAFKSTSIPIHFKEIHLLKWLMGLAKSGDDKVFQTLNNWLHSEEIANISKVDVSEDNVFEILKLIIEIISYQKNHNFEPIIMESFLYIVSNKTFQQYFKHDLKLYLKSICQVIEHIKDTSQLLKILKFDGLFSTLYFVEKKFYKYFCKICLPVLGNIMNDVENNVKNEVVQLVNKCVFQKNTRQFENYLKHIFEQYNLTTDVTIAIILTDSLRHHYNSRNVSAISLIYSSFCSVFESKFEVIYQFTILLLQICGLHMTEKFNFSYDYEDCDYDIEFTINVINEMYNILTTVKTSVHDQVNTINFPTATQLLLSTLMNISNPTKNIMLIFTNAITAEPVVLEPMLGSILPYIMFSNVEENSEEYTILLTNILNVSAKLYRLPNLISKMLPSIKQYPAEINIMEGVFNYKGDVEKTPLGTDCSIEAVFPRQALDCFSKHLLDLPSWQVINIFKTFIFHLKVVAEHLNKISADKPNRIYIELLCTLFSTFLSTVRVTEHTTPDLVVTKFVNNMLELKNTLQIMGDKLLEMNHNQYIMRAYLNVCYAWGELEILLRFYKNLKSNKNDYQVCCTSYVHSYLTAEQWCSITERITNFGEKQCKNIMQSLQLQSIKAIFLFENRKDDIDALFIRNLMQNPSLESLLSDRFLIKVLMPKLQKDVIASLAKEFIKTVLLEGNNDLLRSGALESVELTQVIILNVLIKISKCGKSKEGPKIDIKELLINLFQTDVEDVIVNAELHYKEFLTYFSGQTLNENKIRNYLDLLQKLPVMLMSKNIQLSTFLFISALLAHLTVEKIHTKHQVEKITTGMIQYPSELLSNLDSKFMVPLIINSTSDYKSTFLFWMENMMRNSSNFTQRFDSLISYLLKNFQSNSKVRACIIHVLNIMNKSKKHKVYTEFKNELNEQRDKIYKSIVKFLSTNQECTEEVVHFYALTLKYSLSVDGDQKNDLKTDLNKYVKIVMADINQSNAEACLLLFSTILTHKKQVNIVTDQLILNIWKTIQMLKVSKELSKEYSALVVLVFEHISNESFTVLCEDLDNFVRLSMKDTRDFVDVMTPVNAILQCSLNPIKIKIWQSKVEIILRELVNILVERASDAFKQQVITFEMNIIQANHFMITAPLIDEMFRTIFILLTKSSKQSTDDFKNCIQILNLLLKHRMSLITDRLPSFFQQYRLLLTHICKASDSSLNLSTSEAEDLADCAHQFEKLTKVIVTYGRHVQRIASYVVADILQQYENVAMYSNVKLHIDNCIYSLMTLFDQHAILFLMRSLSTASTELFKYMHNNYKRYYRFTGKV